MLQRMEAEIVAGVDPEPLIKRLAELGFELEVIVWPYNHGVTVIAVTLTLLEEVKRRFPTRF
jgi:hypothetical protein